MGLLPIPAPRLTQGASHAGFWRAAALYDKRLLPPSFVMPTQMNVHRDALCFMVMGPSLLQRSAVGGWWLAVGKGVLMGKKVFRN